MKILDDPFDYPEPFKASKLPERQDELAERRRQKRAQKLGRPIGKHGGYRPGAGRKKTRNYTHIAYIKLDNIQVKLLEDLGKGDLHHGIQQAIERFTDG
jgi:hypothetical protein